MKALGKVRKEREKRERIVQTAHSLKEAQGRIDELEAYVEAIKELRGAKPAYTIKSFESTGTSEAVAVAVATDWHIGCVIDPKTVSGLNKFNVAIAKQRINRFFELVVKLTDKERQSIKISELVLFLGGD
jgi:hypothetical protein